METLPRSKGGQQRVGGQNAMDKERRINEERKRTFIILRNFCNVFT